MKRCLRGMNRSSSNTAEAPEVPVRTLRLFNLHIPVRDMAHPIVTQMNTMAPKPYSFSAGEEDGTARGKSKVELFVGAAVVVTLWKNGLESFELCDVLNVLPGRSNDVLLTLLPLDDFGATDVNVFVRTVVMINVGGDDERLILDVSETLDPWRDKATAVVGVVAAVSFV